MGQVQENTLVANYLAVLCRMITQMGFSSSDLLAGTALTEEDLSHPESQTSLEDYFTLMSNAKRITHDEAIGLRLGQALGVTAHGMLGLAVMSCEVLGESIELGKRFFVTRFPVMRFRSEIQGESLIFTLEETCDLGEHKRSFVESVFASIYTFGEFLVGEHTKQLGVEFATPAAPYPEMYQEIFGDQCLFEQAENRMVCPKHLLTLPLKFFDPATKQLAENTCEKELEKLQAQNTLTKQVSLLIASLNPEYFSIDGVSKRLNSSPRTISRRLKEENTTFQEILDNTRKQQAIYYLTKTDLTITQISHELHFNDSAYFTRAFKKWTGQLPTEYRKNLLS